MTKDAKMTSDVDMIMDLKLRGDGWYRIKVIQECEDTETIISISEPEYDDMPSVGIYVQHWKHVRYIIDKIIEEREKDGILK